MAPAAVACDPARVPHLLDRLQAVKRARSTDANHNNRIVSGCEGVCLWPGVITKHLNRDVALSEELYGHVPRRRTCNAPQVMSL
jgi:hypothetical protein